MIMEFTCASGATFRLDNERMTWQRDYDGHTRGGNLYDWPKDICVGKEVRIIERPNKLTGYSRIFTTTPVSSMKGLIPVKPDEVL